MIIINENKNFLFRYLIFFIHILPIIIDYFINFSSQEVTKSLELSIIKLSYLPIDRDKILIYWEIYI